MKSPPAPAGPRCYHPPGRSLLASRPFMSCPHMEAMRVPFSSLGRAGHPGISQSTPRVTPSALAGGRCPLSPPGAGSCWGGSWGGNVCCQGSSSHSIYPSLCSSAPLSTALSSSAGAWMDPRENAPETRDSECAKQVWGRAILAPIHKLEKQSRVVWGDHSPWSLYP